MENISIRPNYQTELINRFGENARSVTFEQIISEAASVIHPLLGPNAVKVPPFGVGSREARLVFNLITDHSLGPMRHRDCGFTGKKAIEEHIARIDSAMRRNEPIPVSIFLYLGKTANPLVNYDHIQHAGALWTIVRLASIGATIKQAYKPGAHFYICSETNLVRGEDITEGQAREADNYFKDTIRAMGLAEQMEIIDMYALAVEGQEAFHSRYLFHYNRLISGSDLTDREQSMMRILGKTGFRNINPFINETNFEDILAVYGHRGEFKLSPRGDLSENQRNLEAVLTAKAQREAANIFAGVLTKAQSPDYGTNILPSYTIQATITRKANRVVWYPISRNGEMPFPDTGEIVIDKHGNVKVLPLVNILCNTGNQYRSVFNADNQALYRFDEL